MIIECPNCNKKFDLAQSLLPSNGRTLQCGSCDHKWFYILKSTNEINTKNEESEEKKSVKIEKTDYSEETIKKKVENENNHSIKKFKNRSNYLKKVLSVIILFAAIILVLDTFKEPLTSIFPNIKNVLDNLYQSFIDIKLFILDLIK